MGASFTQVAAEDLKAGMKIRTEDNQGNATWAKVYRIRRIDHQRGRLSTTVGEAVVDLNHKFVVGE
jgi:hypothetical protein